MRPPGSSARDDRTAAVVALVVLSGCFVLAVVLTTPWRSADHGLDASYARLPVADDFTAAELTGSAAFHALVGLPAYLSVAAGLLTAVLLGFTRSGSWLVSRVLPEVRAWWARVLLGVLTVTVLTRLAIVPFDLWLERARREAGVSTQTWRSWMGDLAVDAVVGFAVAALLLVLLVGLARRFPRMWWAPASAVAAVALVLGSYVYPLVVEPLYHRFTPMPAGPSRSALLELAAQDGVPVSDVLVADASRRTTRLNAYVSGFGSTRRIVVYDTLLTQATPEQLGHLVAHELGHAKRGDVLRGTLVAALGVALAVVALALVLRSPRLTRPAGVRSAADPRAVALVLALVAVGGLAATPLQNLVSRRVEARADLHALDLTRDPTGYAETQHWLAVTNRSELEPAALTFGLFASHPTAPERIAIVRWWASRRGVPPIPALAGR